MSRLRATFRNPTPLGESVAASLFVFALIAVAGIAH